MSTAVSQFDQVDLSAALERIRVHAALVRALLDELDRLAPISERRPDAERFVALSEQHAEELGRLGCRIVECAAAMTGIPAKPAAWRW
jgi:hypothetical protein